MAPEQHREAKQADARSDVWGLGATLYELLTLQRAFPRGGSVLNAEPIPPHQLNAGLDRDLEAVLLKALRKDPAHRYPTAQALADDLNHWLRHEPVYARPARAARRLGLWSQRNPGWAATILIATLATIAAGAGGTEYYRMQAKAKERQLQLLEIRRVRLGDHDQGWSRTTWGSIARMERKLEERGAVQALAVASLTGLDVRLEKELPIYAQALAFTPDGRLWMSHTHTGEGARLWKPETGLEERRTLELNGPLAVLADGTAWQLGPTYTEPDRPGRTPTDPRRAPGFPLRLLDVERQAIARTLDDPMKGGSRLLAWTLAPKGSHAAAAVVDREGRQQLLIWDATTGHLLQRIACQRSPESPALPGAGLAFAPDATLLATWDGPGRIDLYSVPQGQAITSWSDQMARRLGLEMTLWTLRPHGRPKKQRNARRRAFCSRRSSHRGPGCSWGTGWGPLQAWPGVGTGRPVASPAWVAQVRKLFNVASLRLTVLGLSRRYSTSQRLNCLKSVSVILAGSIGSPLAPSNQAAKASRSNR